MKYTCLLLYVALLRKQYYLFVSLLSYTGAYSSEFAYFACHFCHVYFAVLNVSEVFWNCFKFKCK